MLANKLRISPLVGYLLAGVLAGPFTPGFVADTKLAPELAELGVILLMFGVGLHFSLKDLMAVKSIAIPGAIAQIAVATLLGMALDFTAIKSLSEKCKPTPNISKITPSSGRLIASSGRTLI